MNNAIKLAADIGGTFTDIVLEQGAKRWSGKLLTTTQAPELAVLEGIGLVARSRRGSSPPTSTFSSTARRLPPMR